MLQFSGSVVRNPAGYEWENCDQLSPDDGEDYLTGVFLRGTDFDDYITRLRKEEHWFLPEYIYDPFTEEPALFRIFAITEPTEDGILKFANRYGDIATLEELADREWMTLERWIFEIQLMKEAVEFADSLSKRLAKSSDRRKQALRSEGLEFLNGLLTFPRVFLQAVDKRGRTTLDAIVISLLDVMKLQLVTSVIEGKKYRECEHCSKPFEVTPQINRADRVFCSDNCRVKAYYRRKKEAVRMRQSGLHLREIVKKTGSDLETVKGWVQHIPLKEKQ